MAQGSERRAQKKCEDLGCHKKKQEVNFDLLCRSVPPTDKSCNLLGVSFHKKGTLQVDDMFVIYKGTVAVHELISTFR